LRIEDVAWSAQRIHTAVNLGFLDRFLGLFFDLEDGGSVFLQNVGAPPALQSRKQYIGFEVFTAVVLKSKQRCFAELFYYPEDGGDTFLRNVGYNSTDYTASYPRR
jgi:hypothetical protein